MEGKPVELRFLSQEEMITAGVLDMPRCVAVMEEAFRLMGRGDYLMGGPSGDHHGIKLWFPKEARGPRMPVEGPDRRFMALAAYLGGDFHFCGTKWYGSNITNPRERGLPRSVLLVILNDPDSGAPLAIMDGNLISAMRTGAVVGMAAKYLAPPGASVAGVVAAGVISRTCLMALAAGLPDLREVKVFDIDQEKARTFCAGMSAELDLDVHPVDSLEAVVRGSDAVSTAAAGTVKPHYPTEWFVPGAFFGLSSEVDIVDDLWLSARVVADNWRMHMDWREEFDKVPEQREHLIYHELHDLIVTGRMRDADVVELGRVVAGTVPGRNSEDQLTILVAGGLGIEDVAWGATVYRNAVAQGLGQTLRLWDSPHWF